MYLNPNQSGGGGGGVVLLHSMFQHTAIMGGIICCVLCMSLSFLLGILLLATKL